MFNDYSLLNIFLSFNIKKEYYNLNDEERNDIDYFDFYINSDNYKIRNASFYTMMLILKISNNIEEFTNEMVDHEKDEIFKDLNLEEKTIMNKFMLSCINCMGIFGEKMKNIRKLKKERND